MPDFTTQHDFLVAIDSDGCVFDTMELKHKECFIPAFINSYNLQAVSKYAPRGVGVRESLFQEPRGESLPGAGRDASVAAAAARSEGPRR